MTNSKEIENYLSDLDNLIDTGHFPEEKIANFTFYHKDFNLRNFIQKGRNYIGEFLSIQKTKIEEIKKITKEIEDIKLSETIYGNLSPDEIHNLRAYTDELLQKVKQL